jgi:hypothetical protein
LQAAGVIASVFFTKPAECRSSQLELDNLRRISVECASKYNVR